MKTAMLSSSPTQAGGSAAIESAVDAYASRVLEAAAPAEAVLDGSLGPYVTSVLRSVDEEESSQDVTSSLEFEALVELLEDQCNMEPEAATKVLQQIAKAVVSGVIPPAPRKLQAGGLYSNGASLDSYPVAGGMNLEVTTQKLEQLSMAPYTPNAAGGPSPLKPDNLIPVDLLGFLDDPSPYGQRSQTAAYAPPGGSMPTPVAPQQQEEQKTAGEEAFPPLSSAAAKSSSTTKGASKKGRKAKGGGKSSSSDKELAAALFRPSRPRQNSIENEDSSSPPLSSVPPPPQDPQHLFANDPFFQQQVASCVEILLSMNGEVGEEAATEAALMANADFNVALYIVDKALTAPPVCRHMLHDGCYRSDCQFSHDVEGHTCIFWLRGRCTKPVSVCKFLHGFHPKLMEGMAAAPTPQTYVYSPYSQTDNSTINGNIMTGQPQQSWQAPSVAESSASNSYASSAGSNNGSSSFANIASRGGNLFAAASPPPATSTYDTTPSIPTVRIPQNLWNAHENRDSSVFYVADPLERYRQVSQMNGAAARNEHEIIDLHFQSTKTFGTVLEHILPQKLQTAPEPGVWIVTGTGHHVGTKTHQKGGGALERAVIEWLQDQGYSFAKGKDRNGLGGAILVRG